MGNPTIVKEDAMLTCSFCGLDQDAVKCLLAGPGVNICDQCIGVGVRVIATRDALEKPVQSPDGWVNTDDDALLAEIAATSALLDKTRSTLQSQVAELRRRQVGWDAIGAALGLSRQVVLERFC